jgi:hypothetical protein
MMPISHYVGLILSHGVQMCSFFSIIYCNRLENALRYKTSLKQLTLVMYIGYLDFDGPSELLQSVFRVKTHKTLKCTFSLKKRSFWGLRKIFWESASDCIFFTGKAKVHWLGIKVDSLNFQALWKQNLPLKRSLPH